MSSEIIFVLNVVSHPKIPSVHLFYHLENMFLIQGVEGLPNRGNSC